ncbi:fatty acid desaturase [Rhodocytophaga aerolata]|uniref:Fatty acid desaturase n=1 Tax=Rhodocytophaga aerolata TaxID=455078 RepID=A0ABT8RFC1_9BACT|nr:fatty acid desaturase [Rhodocytophaga aerolata]MDO1449863.1 fatty acid desaturase [Rhodocytophaga aerolata]
MKLLSQIHDPVYRKKEKYTIADKFFLRLIRDERDLPFMYLTVAISCTLVPMAIFLYLPLLDGWLWWLFAAGYLLLNNFYFKGPFGLMLHCTSHRKLFKKAYNWANYYLPWMLGPFFGQTPETYFSHHIGMHHPENNLPEDKSCTMFYQRDSLRGFMNYFCSFLFTGIFGLSAYFLKKNRKKLLISTIMGELAFFVMCIALSFLDWKATLVVFILPFLISRFISMLGNWTQHAFIDAADPGNPYKNSITCINTVYNKKCWNDGYHISHHIRPSMHWTQHPVYFLTTKKEYARNQAIVFDGVDYLAIFYYLMRKRYDILATHVVNIENTYSSHEQIIALLKQRTQQIAS